MKDSPDSSIKSFVKSSLASGIALLATLPVAMTVGINSGFFDLIAILHFSLQTFLIIKIFLLLSEDPCKERGLKILAAFTTFGVIGLSLISTTTPIISRDALIHHLAVPKMWIESGEILQIPWHEWSFYPMLANLAYLPLIKWGVANLTPLYHGSYLILLAGAIFATLRSLKLDLNVSYFGYILALTIPISLRLATEPLVDLPLAYFSALALLIAIRCVNNGLTNTKERWPYTPFVIGIFLGFALSTKFNGIPYLLTFLIFFTLFALRMKISKKNIAISLIWIGIGITAAYGPWMAKSYGWTGNPIFPLFRNIFGPVNSFEGLGVSELQKRVLGFYGESYLDIVTTPLRMMFVGEDDNPRRFDGLLSPLLILALFAFRRRGNPPWLIPLTIGVVTYLIISQLYAAPRVRYIAPLFAPLVIISSYALNQPFGRGSAKIILASLASISLGVIYSIGLFDRIGGYTIGDSNKRQKFLERSIPEYQTITWVNQSIPHDALIYQILTGNRFYLLDRKTRSPGHYPGEFWKFVNGSKSSQELLHNFQSVGATHLMFNAGRVVDFLDNKGDGNTEKFDQFLSNCTESVFISKKSDRGAIEQDFNLFILSKLREQCLPQHEIL